jgi:regulator of PEP synthase PpsR (kinase-PPPase family)
MEQRHIVQLEIHVQHEVLEEIAKDSEEKCGKVVCACAAMFRKIIKEFEEKFGRPPTKDELIWVCSEKMQKNIREL